MCVGIKHIILVRLSINGVVRCVEKGEGRKESEDAVQLRISISGYGEG